VSATSRARHALQAMDRFWYAPAPAERLAVVRIACGGFALVYLLVRAPGFVSVARFAPSLFEPVGPVALATSPLQAFAVYALYAVTVLLGAAFVAGAAYRATGPLFALSFLWMTSYRSSWGMVFHTDNLPTLHLLILALAPAADVLASDRRKAETRAGEDGRYGWPLRAMAAVTVATYVLAGIAKLRASGWDWVTGDVLRTQIAYDNLRKIELGSLHSPFGVWLVKTAWIFPIMAAVSLSVEMGAPLALIGTRVAAYWVALAWAFHVGVLLTMAIGFPYPLSGVAYAAFFPVERVLAWKRLRALRRHE
jgi:hypothetical protein